MLWTSAWREGGGTATLAAKPAVTKPQLINLYSKKPFLESCTLFTIGKYW
jgi:CBS domain